MPVARHSLLTVYDIRTERQSAQVAAKMTTNDAIALTFFLHKAARMVEQKGLEVVAVGIEGGLLAQAGGAKKRECLQRLQGRLALGDGDRAAGNCTHARTCVCCVM